MEGVAVELPTPAIFAAAAVSSTSSSSSPPPPFLSKTYDMVDDPATDSMASWSESGNSFVVWNVPELSRDVLPKYFKHNNFSSFVRQLNTYGFRKVDPDRWEFANDGFLRGQKHLLKRISRRKPTTGHPQQQQQQQQSISTESASSKSCVEVGKFGLDGDVERLKSDKNDLMQELVRLRQHQHSTDKHLQNVGQRVQVMEQRQQQMMSFLAKAMHNPGFLAHLVQQQNERSQQITGMKKKRRLPKKDEDDFVGNKDAGPDGPVFKFQPLINEAAKSMLRQILKMNASPLRDQSVCEPNAFLIDGLQPPSPLDNGYSTAQNFGVTLTQGPAASVQLSIPAETALPAEYSSVLSSDSLVSTQIAMDPFIAAGSSEVNIHSNEQATILPGFDLIPEVLQVGRVPFPNMSFASNETSCSSVMGPVAAVADETVPIEADEVYPHQGLDVLLDNAPKLPGSNDAFWEQFFSSVSTPNNTEDSSSIAEGEPLIEHGQPTTWDNAHHVSSLTEQMGLLSSECRRI